jgi:hypothetical protein
MHQVNLDSILHSMMLVAMLTLLIMPISPQVDGIKSKLNMTLLNLMLKMPGGGGLMEYLNTATI